MLDLVRIDLTQQKGFSGSVNLHFRICEVKHKKKNYLFAELL